MYREIYLDNSATTRPFDEVIDFMSEINRSMYGNPSSLHTKGIEAEKLVKKAREVIAGTMNVSSKEVYFTSGGTESNNLAIRGYLEANPRKGRHIITTKIEHPSILEVFKHLATHGYKVDYLNVDNKGLVDLESLRNMINDETTLISIMLINNETGTVQPIDEISKVKNLINNKTVLHVDAVQAYGKLAISPGKSGIDMLSVSSHKIHGPKGIGALYVNKSVKIKPVIFGGGQESLIRSGTENVPGICGFGLAAEKVFNKMEDNRIKVQNIKALFVENLKNSEIKYMIISPEESSPYILNVSFENLRSEVLLHHLEGKNIYVSTGSACSSRKNVHSHVLKAMGVKPDEIEGAVRFSFSSFNTEDDVLNAIDALNEIVPKIQVRHGGRR